MIEKGQMKETGKCIAEIREEEDALEGIKGKNDSGHEVGPLLLEIFELKDTESHAGVLKAEGDGPLMGLTKNNFAENNEGAEGNTNCKQNGTTCVKKVYSRSRGCRKQLDHNITDGPTGGL